MIHYLVNIPTEEDDVMETYWGTTNTAKLLEKLLFQGYRQENAFGHIYTSAFPKCELCFASNMHHGFYFGHINERGKLHVSFQKMMVCFETIEMQHESLSVAEGLFVPAQSGWKVIETFVQSGSMDSSIQWIREEDIPQGWEYFTMEL